MDSTLENQSDQSEPQSLKAAWRHCKELSSASTWSAAWESFKKVVEAMPAWGLVVVVVCVVGLLANLSIVVIPAAGVAFLAALYYTIKHAVLSALGEFDASRGK